MTHSLRSLLALRILGACAALLTAVGLLVAGPASASPTASNASPVEYTNVAAGYVSGWASNTFVQAHPTYLASRAALLAPSVAKPAMRANATQASGAVHPDSAFICAGPNGDVCIDVQGSGLHVSQWNTYAFGNVGCAEAHYFRAGASVFTSRPICPDSSDDGVYYYYTSPDQNLRNNTVLCNTWEYFYGKPCATVHS